MCFDFLPSAYPASYPDSPFTLPTPTYLRPGPWTGWVRRLTATRRPSNQARRAVWGTPPAHRTDQSPWRPYPQSTPLHGLHTSTVPNAGCNSQSRARAFGGPLAGVSGGGQGLSPSTLCSSRPVTTPGQAALGDPGTLVRDDQLRPAGLGGEL